MTKAKAIVLWLSMREAITRKRRSKEGKQATILMTQRQRKELSVTKNGNSTKVKAKTKIPNKRRSNH